MLRSLPSLPRWLRTRPRSSRLRIAWLLLVVPLPAHALDVAVDSPRERGGYVYCDAHLHELFEPRIRESLARGMPATLSLRAELWRRRRGWFDRLETSYETAVRIRYEVWSEQYRIDRPAGEGDLVPSLEEADHLLSRPWALPVGRIGQFQPQGSYYVVVSAVLKPLSVEDVQEVEGWLSGEVETQRRAGLGVVTELPRALFDAVRNFAGFGDRRVRAVSEDFDLEALFPNGH